MKFVIEHLDNELYEWCLIEYKHISEIVDKNNLIFTNIKNNNDIKTLENQRFSGHQKSKGFFSELKMYGDIFEKSFSELNLGNACVLSQYADKTLASEDKNKFEYFLFGGILGDNPAKRRTNEVINKLKKSNVKFEERNLGDKQMSTDAAVYVAKNILDGRKLNDFKFVDEIEIEINENESVTLPFRYVVEGNKLVINKKLVDYIRNKKEF